MIEILTTGGTIDKIYFDAKSTYEVGSPQITQVLREANVTVPFRVTTLLRKDSLDMTDTDRQKVLRAVRRSRCRRIMITHGTDTMTQTAELLRQVRGKTIVLTGSMQPALFRVTDAVFNIASAFMAVQLLAPGVYIVMNGRVFEAGKVRKNRSRNRFEPARSRSAKRIR
ncbi:MAG: asparaginase [Deltaproteobacteria bacterium]|nr:MAG: asparaginase [Deltaproteobacteria bacterium]